MDKHIEELKKAALAANLHGWTGFEESLNVDGYSEVVSKFIEHCSPSVILGLLAKQEAAEKEIHGLKMKLSDAGCLLVEWKQRVEKADKERDELEMSQNVANDATCIWKGRAKAAETRLLVPVKLPRMHVGFDGVSTNAGDSVRNKTICDCSEAIRLAGFTVDEGQDLWLT